MQAIFPQVNVAQTLIGRRLAPLFIALAAMLLPILASAPAHAQATRTWVSGVGDDANPCSRTAPCKTFAGAISKTAAGGQINCIDAGGFGGVTITKSMAIQCDNVEAGILVSGTNGVTVNAGVGDVVFLSGLDFQGVGTGLNGINFLSGKALHVKNCVIRGFATNGINFAPGTATASLVVQDTVVADNPNAATGGGILVKPGAGFNANVTLTNVRMVRNVFGIRAEDRSMVSIFNSIASSNTNNGILAASTSTLVQINLFNTVVSNNGINGIVTSGGNAQIRIAQVGIFGNGTGINVSSGGTVTSFTPATNANSGNGSAGAPNGAAIPLQ